MARPQPPQQPPPVMRLLITYGKTGRLRFASHRDFARAFERGLRRAAVPMAYSSGFSPHPRLSYINPAPTGVESMAEYLVIGLNQTVDPAVVQAGLAAAMPAGFPIICVTPVSATPAFGASLWQIDLPGAGVEQVRADVTALRAAQSCEVTRQTKNGPRTFDILAPLERILVQDRPEPAGAAPQTRPPSARLRVIIRHTEPLVRPDDVLAGLISVDPGLDVVPARVTRLAQGEVEFLGTI